MKLKIIIKTLLILLITLNINAEIKDKNDFVDRAGKQRMISQKIKKEYMLSLLETPEIEKKYLKDIKEFSTNLKELEEFVIKNKMKVSNEKVKKQWETIQELLKTPKKEEAKKINNELNKLLKYANEYVTNFVKEAKMAQLDIINISGRQRMMSQKLAGLYLMKILEVQNDISKSKKILKDFKEKNDYLLSLKQNNVSIINALKEVEEIYFRFKKLLLNPQVKMPMFIDSQSLELLFLTNKATNEYAKILN